MKFSHIEMLFLIWAIPVFFLVIVTGMKTRQTILTRFASPKGIAAIAPETGARLRWTRAGLVLCSLLFLCIALSGPQYGYKWQTITQKGVDIMVAIDLSRSMLATDIQPTRLDRAKREIYDLLTMLKGDRMGLVAFSGAAFLQCPLTLDYEAFNIFLNSLTPDSMPVGGTDISGAITTSLSAFDPKANSQKAIILITDGENTGRTDPLDAAENARNAGVKLFCIGVGSHEGVPVPSKDGGIQKDQSGNIILTRIDEETLKKMAGLTDGAYVRSTAGNMDLDVIYTREIRGKNGGIHPVHRQKADLGRPLSVDAGIGHLGPWRRIADTGCSKKIRGIGRDIPAPIGHAGSCRKPPSRKASTPIIRGTTTGP